MIKKIIIIFFLIFSISNTAFSKSPPLGTGSLVPSNIMIMLDNSGSMGWNLAGNELSTGGELNRPTEIKTDSAGNIYVLQTSNTYFQGKNYRMHVFNSDGTFKKRMNEYKYRYNPTCPNQSYTTPRFDIYDDKIYIMDNTYYDATIKVISTTTGQCLQHKRNVSKQRYGSYTTEYS